MFVVNHAEIPHLFRNDGGNYYDWFRVKVYDESGRQSLGAKVYVKINEDPDSVEPARNQQLSCIFRAK